MTIPLQQQTRFSQYWQVLGGWLIDFPYRKQRGRGFRSGLFENLSLGYTTFIVLLTLSTGRRGCPSYVISEEQLEVLVEHGFTTTQIAKLLGTSSCTISRRLRQFRLLHRQRFSSVSDDTLDLAVVSIQQNFPNCGYRMMQAHLQSIGLVVQWQRVRDSLVQVDPLGTALRWSVVIPWCTYCVVCLNSLWHIDTHQFLVRWGFSVHEGIDGYSRLITYLKCATYTQASMVLCSFLQGVRRYGCPSRVRSNHGMENCYVARFMLWFRGCGRGSHITGPSVHN